LSGYGSSAVRAENIKEAEMRSTLKKFTRPVITPFEDPGPVGFAKTVAHEYATMENGHPARLRWFLRRAYRAYHWFRESPKPSRN
jgi:hypothetical protein